jgi:hypothetical protein
MGTILTTEQLLERGRRESAAERKAEASPAELTSEDLPSLSGTTLSRLAGSGSLAHLGVGGRKHAARRYR